MRQDKDSEKESDIEHNAKHVIDSQREQEWLKENKVAIEKQNERMEKEGSFSE